MKFKQLFINPLPDDPTSRKVLVQTLFFTSAFYMIYTLFAIYLSASGQEDELLRYTKDDGIVEWLQFLIYFSVALFILFAHYVSIQEKKFKLASLPSLGMLMVVALFVFGAMEEISWGQRLVDRESSEFFISHNRQNETNLHNLVVNGVSLNRLIFGKILFLVIFAHNLILPILAAHKKSVTALINDKLGGCYPPLLLSAVYIVGSICVEFIAHERRKELLELIGGTHYFAMVFFSYGLGFQVKNSLFKGQSALYASRFFMGYLLVLSGLAWCLSVAIRTS